MITNKKEYNRWKGITRKIFYRKANANLGEIKDVIGVEEFDDFPDEFLSRIKCP